MQRKAIARTVYRTALNLRRKHGIDVSAPVCVIDLCEKEGIEVRLLEISSFEGLYCKSNPPTILISAVRPTGRQNFTCAHELGHHCFGHGEHLDVLVENSLDAGAKLQDEFIADRFAAALLMPHVAIDFGFGSRNWNLAEGNPLQYYVIASWLGVGYSTLINHLAYTLKAINHGLAEQLKLVKPLDIKSELLQREFKGNLLVLDRFWVGRAADIQQDDRLILPANATVEGVALEVLDSSASKLVVTGAEPGIARVEADQWSAYVRVSRKNYSGRAIFRFLEEG